MSRPSCFWLSSCSSAGGLFTWAEILPRGTPGLRQRRRAIQIRLVRRGRRSRDSLLSLAGSAARLSRSHAGPGRLQIVRARLGGRPEIPVGFSKKRVGFARVTNNCAICHTATYRLQRRRNAACRGRRPAARQQPAGHAPLSFQSGARPALQFRHDHERNPPRERKQLWQRRPLFHRSPDLSLPSDSLNEKGAAQAGEDNSPG